MTVARRGIARLTMAAVVAATSLVLASGVNAPAQAAQCTSSADAGNKRALSTSYSGRWVLKQSDRKENFSGVRRNITFTLDKSSLVTNTVGGYAEGTIEGRLGWAKLQGKVGGSLEKLGTKTRYRSLTESISLKSGHIYVNARGARKDTMKLTFQRCAYQHPAGYIWQTYKRTSANGWTKVDTLIACDKATPAGSFSRYVKKAKC